MSYIYSRALAEAFSQASCSAIDASAPSSKSPTPRPSLWSDKTTDLSRLSRFGMTCEPSTGDRGAALLTWWLAAFPARTLAGLAPAQESKDQKAGFGWRWQGSFTKFDPSSSSWKTRQCSLLGGLETFSETWPRWGSMRDGECLALTTPELRTSAKESGFWPTIRASDGERGGRGDLLQAVRGNQNKHFKMYSTPVASDTGHRKTRYAQGGTALSMQVGGPLNPTWTEWLMGWPSRWTELAPLAMARFREWQQQHGIYSVREYE